MKLIGLTGGIASGKSTVASMLREKGAIVLDADIIGHEVYERDQPAYALVVDRFGEGVVAANGSIDRKALGEIVFNDTEARCDLEAIVHPEIFREIAARIAERITTDDLVVVDAPLIVETLGPGRAGPLELDALVVVSTSPQDQIERLVRDRTMTPHDARTRIDAQAPLESKIAAADYVIHNRGDLENLRASVDLFWVDVQESDDGNIRIG
ncbi:MAG: dephospho-CoA kinase [Actinomycetota bacterium]